MFQDEYVLANRRACQPLLVRCRRKRGLQRTDRGKIKICVAPLQQPHGFEVMAFERLYKFRLKGIASSGRAKCAVTCGAAGTAGNLGEFGRIEFSELIAVE